MGVQISGAELAYDGALKPSARTPAPHSNRLSFMEPHDMPALTIPSPPNTHCASPTDTAAIDAEGPVSPKTRTRSQSPDRPPVSPITPTLSPTQLPPPLVAPAELPKPSHVPPQPATMFQKQPSPVPISESDNPDVIALRSAISLLQLQREKSKRDIKALQDLKTAAVADPEGFARHLQNQRKHSLNSDVDPLSPTLSGILDDDTDSTAGAAIGVQDGDAPKGPASAEEAQTKFPPIPQPQNVVRCPPIAWEKYKIVGEPLDKLHEQQRRWPGSKEPPRTKTGNVAPAHAVASPYSPYTDVLGSGPSQKSAKKSPS